VRPCSAAVPGREARIDNEYERCGTANVFCAVEPKADTTSPFPRRTAPPSSLPSCLPCGDSVSRRRHHPLDRGQPQLHRRKSLTDLLGQRSAARSGTDHRSLHTGSRQWLNQAEIEIGIFSDNARTQKNPDLKTLTRETRAWNRRMNRDRIQDQLEVRSQGGPPHSSATKGTLSSGHRPSVRNVRLNLTSVVSALE